MSELCAIALEQPRGPTADSQVDYELITFSRNLPSSWRASGQPGLTL